MPQVSRCIAVVLMLSAVAELAHAKGAQAQLAQAQLAQAEPKATGATCAPPAAEAKAAGDQAMLDGQHELALACYERAYDHEPEPRLLYNRARALEHLQQFVPALQLLLRFEVEAPPDLRARVPQLTELKTTWQQHVGRVQVRAPEGAAVWINGYESGQSPLVHPMIVEPGRVELEVRKEGYQPFVTTLDVAAGEQLVVQAELVAAPPGVTPGGTANNHAASKSLLSEEVAVTPASDEEARAAVDTSVPPRGSTALDVAMYGAFGVGALGALTAGVSYALAVNAREEVCGGASTCTSDQADTQALDRYDTQRRVYSAGLVVAGVGIAAGAGLLLWKVSQDGDPSSRVSVQGSVGWGSVQLRGQF